MFCFPVTTVESREGYFLNRAARGRQLCTRTRIFPGFQAATAIEITITERDIKERRTAFSELKMRLFACLKVGRGYPMNLGALSQ